MPRTLIVNADDYGLTRGTSEAILHAAEHGIVTSTSVLVLAPAAVESLALLSGRSIGVGVHLALVGEDPPLLPPEQIPSLVDERGGLPIDWRTFLGHWVRGRIDRRDVERELRAQVELVRGHGVRVAHLDSHQHLHLWPPVGDIVAAMARELGVAGVRVPTSAGRGPKALGIRTLSRRLRRRLHAYDVATPGVAAGLDEAGHLDEATLVRSIRSLAARGGGSAELGTHPGADGDADRDRYDWGYEWGVELAALCSPSARSAVADAGFVLGTYADLAGRP